MLVLGVNSYVTLDEAELYFENRPDVAAWITADDELKEQSLIAATSQLDMLSFAGYTTVETQNLAWPRVGGVSLLSRGRDLTFSSKYVFADVSLAADFDTAFKQLPYEIQLLKEATFEQAYHIVNNDGILDATGSSPDTIKVGSITLSGLGTRSDAPNKSTMARKILKPLLISGAGAGGIWFRSN